jgi:UDP-N-acetyl-D-galactosamine dehydrogenase
MEKIAVLGLGYVGLPLALALAKKFPNTVGFDLNEQKINAIKNGIDPTDEGLTELITNTTLSVSSEAEVLKDATFFIAGVPTPVDIHKQPDLSLLIKACDIIGKFLKRGDIVVFESTVYPGVTEEKCGKHLERVSGLRSGIDFKLGYSPERINPGDVAHTLENVVKVIAAQDKEALQRMDKVYGAIIKAGVFQAKSIKVAEAAKVIENTQRDLNIALINELSIIFDRLDIRTQDVLEAAQTKWNFLKFTPGLVGGHCIGVDPYYLTQKAQEVGYHPEVILAGRRINDEMGRYVGQKIVKLLVKSDIPVRGARVGILGATFKENVTDTRNSRISDLVAELEEYDMKVLIHDPVVLAARRRLGNGLDALEDHGEIHLVEKNELRSLDCLVLAVPHQEFLQESPKVLLSGLRRGGVFIDLKSKFSPELFSNDYTYWSL